MVFSSKFLTTAVLVVSFAGNGFVHAAPINRQAAAAVKAQFDTLPADEREQLLLLLSGSKPVQAFASAATSPAASAVNEAQVLTRRAELGKQGWGSFLFDPRGDSVLAVGADVALDFAAPEAEQSVKATESVIKVADTLFGTCTKYGVGSVAARTLKATHAGLTACGAKGTWSNVAPSIGAAVIAGGLTHYCSSTAPEGFSLANAITTCDSAANAWAPYERKSKTANTIETYTLVGLGLASLARLGSNFCGSDLPTVGRLGTCATVGLAGMNLYRRATESGANLKQHDGRHGVACALVGATTAATALALMSITDEAPAQA